MAISYPNLRCAMEQYPSWPGGTNQEIADWVNTPSINFRPDNAAVRDLWNVIIEEDDYDTLTDAQRDLVRTTLFGGGNSFVDISDNFTPEAVMLIRVFTGTPTLTALNNAFTYQKTPGEHYNVGGVVNEGHIQEARTWTCPE